MARRIDCPYPDIEAHIELPDVWLGSHAERRDETLAKLRVDYGQTLQNFGVSLALLDNWQLPGLNGNPDKWDFNKLDLRLIAWVSGQVLGDFSRCWIVPKEQPLLSENGSMAAAKAEEAGSLETN